MKTKTTWHGSKEIRNAVAGLTETSAKRDKWRMRCYYAVEHFKVLDAKIVGLEWKVNNMRSKFVHADKERQVLKDWIRENSDEDPFKILKIGLDGKPLDLLLAEQIETDRKDLSRAVHSSARRDRR